MKKIIQEGHSSTPEKAALFHKQKIWDLPTRLFHCVLAISVFAGWYYGEYRDFTTIEWHFYIGQFIGVLLVFRLFWGFFGPKPVRFKTFTPTRFQIMTYLKNAGKRQPTGAKGHNPIGGLSVIALLITLSMQIITGFYSEDDGLFASGPMVRFTEAEWVLTATSLHHYLSRLLLVLIVLHLAAIAFYYFWKKENLISAMITGIKKVLKD